MSEMSLEEFLEHKATGSGGGKFLSKWKDGEKDCDIDVVLSRRAPIVSLWRHQIPRVDAVEKDGVSARVVKSASWVCHETEDLLRNQNRRDKETRVRLIPPKSCPACLLIEHFHDRVQEGDLDWLAPVFRFEGTDGKPPHVIHAAGLYNGFSRDDLTPTEKGFMNAAGVYQKHAWKEDCRARLNYIFRVAQYDAPDLGLQIATESGLLGDKVKTLIKDAMVSLGKDRGNPAKTPYVIRWQHRPNEREFGKKYHALRIDPGSPEAGRPITEVVLRTIESDPPDISQMTAKLDPGTLRAVLERACLVDGVPWDELFGPRREVTPQQPKLPEVSVASAVNGSKDDLVECDGNGAGGCGKAILMTDKSCPHCGFIYVKEPPPPVPPKPTMRKRSEVAPPAPKAPPTNPGFGVLPDDFDGLPF